MCQPVLHEGRPSSGSKETAAGGGGPSAAPSSPVRQVDPVVRAIHTLMYGLVVHFGTLWTIESSIVDKSGDVEETSIPATYQGRLLAVLFLHEYWVYLQHSNVFGNPLLQRLDRQYGIALLKSNRHWSIAGTLSAYWARETLGMFLCLPFLQPSSAGSGGFSSTQYLILYSLIYHTIKSRGVRQDALTRSSSRFGIMRLVIDKFYTHSREEAGLSVLRLFLQGFDTFIHYRIVRDLVILSGSSYGWLVWSMHVLFAVWVVHAALNQLFRCSTASVMVQAWHALTTSASSAASALVEEVEENAMRRSDSAEALWAEHNEWNGYRSDEEEDDTVCTEGNDEYYEWEEIGDKDDDTDGESVSSQSEASFVNENNAIDENCSSMDEDFIVRQLLHPKRVSDDMKGRQGAASGGVDRAVRLETAIAILSAFFMLGIDEVPLRALSEVALSECLDGRRGFERAVSAVQNAWILWGLLYGMWAMFLKSRAREQSVAASPPIDESPSIHRRRSLVRMLDLGVVIGIAHAVPSDIKARILITCAFLTAKAFLQSRQLPKVARRSLAVIEFVSKLVILRTVADNSPDSTMISSMLAVVWTVWVVSNPVPTPCEAAQLHSCEMNSNVADVVFLGHPALLSDAWALWLRPYSLKERWQAPFWAWPLWPVHFLVGWYVCNYRRKLFGDGASFFSCDDVRHGRTRMQCWVASHFGRHFVTNPREVKENIEAAARHAERTGVKVLCLGALNKAESINEGGMGVVKALGPDRRLSVIHGNHLTAAAVVETIHQCFGDRQVKFFLTGASSKVGWAVAQALKDRHQYEVLCHSTDQGRRHFFKEKGFESASTLAEGSAFSKYWIVGKYDMNVARLIPQGATAVVFAVPHPLESRKDVRVIEAGTLHMDLSRLDRPRQFTNKLREHEVFACHAASLVAAYRLKRGASRIDEVGPVDPQVMDSWLVDAKKLGFSVPQYEPVCEANLKGLTSARPPVVIVGAGPSGLAVAATLSQKRIPHVVLEAEEDEHTFGSWSQHFTGLEITTQKKWCALPGMPMGDEEFPNETVTAQEYQRYLMQYVNRFAINIRRGVSVTSIEKGSDQTPYIVKVHSSNGEEDDKLEEVAAWAVVACTGKHRVPQKNTSDDLAGKLESCGVPFVHSTEMNDEATRQNAIEAAENGSLCIVGLGNSASDLATMILQQCPADGTNKPTIHIAARTIPPVFPRRAKFLRVDTLGYLMRLLPGPLQELMVRLLWWGIPGSQQCDAAFPSHLKRWSRVQGRVPVIDKLGLLAAGFESGRLVGHGPVQNVNKEREVTFGDHPSAGVLPAAWSGTKIDMCILATGYREQCVVDREDRLNGLYKCGFGKSDRFLPLRSICEDAERIAEDIAASY